MSAKKINYWYKDFLSEFSFEEKQKVLFPEKSFDTVDSSEKEIIYIKNKSSYYKTREFWRTNVYR